MRWRRYPVECIKFFWSHIYKGLLRLMTVPHIADASHLLLRIDASDACDTCDSSTQFDNLEICVDSKNIDGLGYSDRPYNNPDRSTTSTASQLVIFGPVIAWVMQFVKSSHTTLFPNPPSDTRYFREKAGYASPLLASYHSIRQSTTPPSHSLYPLHSL